MSELDAVLSRLEGVRRSGEGWLARCPCHEDREPSLSIGIGRDGRLLLKCFAGCAWDSLRAALGLERGNGASVEVGRYSYRDEDGRQLYEKIRFVPKKFVREPRGAPSSLYRLELLGSVAGHPLFLSESEKDADAVIELGRGETIAVSSGGASTWRETWADAIARGRPRLVAVLQHADKAGGKFAVRVAASLAKRGLSVRLLSFRGAEGYDVADAIRDGLTLDELRARVEAEPEWVPSPRTAKDGLELLTLGDLLSMPAETTSWVWEGRIPSGGLAGLFAKPKGGKSTTARCLALAVARGEAFLGFPTARGAVIYLGLEEKKHEVKAHFEALGAREDDPIHVLIATAPADGLERLRVDAERLRPALVIIDTLSRLVRLRDGNDYAEVSRELEPVLALARETGAAVLFVHHLGKGERNEQGDAILGSTAIFAAVDTALLVKRTERYRTLSSIQRYGQDLEEITLGLDAETRAVTHGGTRAEADEARYGEEILARMEGADDELSEKEALEPIEGRLKDKRAALGKLVDNGRILRAGAGKKGDPYRYSFPDFPYIYGKSGNESEKPAQTPEREREMLFPVSREGEGNESASRKRNSP